VNGQNSSNSRIDSTSKRHFKYVSLSTGWSDGVGNYQEMYGFPNWGRMVNISGGILFGQTPMNNNNGIGFVVSLEYYNNSFTLDRDTYNAGGGVENLTSTNFQVYNGSIGIWFPIKLAKGTSIDIKVFGGVLYSILPTLDVNAQGQFYNHAGGYTYPVTTTTTPNTPIIEGNVKLEISLRFKVLKNLYAELPYFSLMEALDASFHTQTTSTSNISTQNYGSYYNMQTGYMNIGAGLDLGF